VEELNLWNCGLMALSGGVGRLVGLKRLNLCENKGLTTLPAVLWTLAGLEELNLAGCGLTALPEGIGALTGLRVLDLHNCGLTALPEGMEGAGWAEEAEPLRKCGTWCHTQL
jgi:Leucine-rich repeat (LRR) protein